MYIIFFSTSNVFKAEEMLNSGKIPCSVVPTPVQDKAYCGVCIQTKNRRSLEVLNSLEHVAIEEDDDVI
ncbi:MAG: DUF3343 domain-containing protein [Lactobacillus sp.]|nr:DUF3343 domain-containing protein [Lactobacillus sp.]